jgi:hypothetical protein
MFTVVALSDSRRPKKQFAFSILRACVLVAYHSATVSLDAQSQAPTNDLQAASI